jgi:hypothetical protein
MASGSLGWAHFFECSANFKAVYLIPPKREIVGAIPSSRAGRERTIGLAPLRLHQQQYTLQKLRSGDVFP